MYNNIRKILLSAVNEKEIAAHGTQHLLSMYDEIASREQPIVLELGTKTGVSTSVFLGALHERKGGHLYSVDIVDCSKVANSPYWTFIQSDSADIEGILSSAPALRSGIDVLYVDSLHYVDHIRKELFGFFPFVKAGGVIFFDDVDSLPYMRHREKDNIHTEIGNRLALKFLNEVFEDNVERLHFSVSRGSTGLARMEKRSALGDNLSVQHQPRLRKNKRYWKTRRSILKRLKFLFPRIEL